MTSTELSEWMAYSRIEPLPNPHLTGGIISATIANCHRAKRKPYKPREFMPISKAPKMMTTAEMKAKAMSWVGHFKDKPTT